MGPEEQGTMSADTVLCIYLCVQVVQFELSDMEGFEPVSAEISSFLLLLPAIEVPK